jgi:acetylornithine deacetylase/succinyl-diaminopimelate desuccinylase-like protein
LAEACRRLDGTAIGRLAVDLVTADLRPDILAPEFLMDRFREAGVRARVDRSTDRPVVLAEVGGSQGPIYTIGFHGHLDSVRSRDQPTILGGGTVSGRGIVGMKGALAAMVAAAGALSGSAVVGRTQRVLFVIPSSVEPPIATMDDVIERNLYGDAVISGCRCHLGSEQDARSARRSWSVPVAAAGGGPWTIHAVQQDSAGPPLLDLGAGLLRRLAMIRDAWGVGASLWVEQVTASAGPPADCVVTGHLRYADRLSGEAAIADLAGLAQKPSGSTIVTVDVSRLSGPWELEPGEPLLTSVRKGCLGAGVRGAVKGVRLSHATPLSRFHELAGIPATALGLEPTNVGSDVERASLGTLLRLARAYALAAWHYLDSVTP